MGKVQPKKRNSSSAGSPYTKNLPSGSLKKNPIFKFNTDIGIFTVYSLIHCPC